jgi:periplasmic copper chaperone A
MHSYIRRVCVAMMLAMPAAAFAVITIEAPWIRGVVPGQSATGVFMRIHSTEATELVAVSSPVAANASVHRTAMVDGMMSMEPIDSLALPPQGGVALEPGGFHVMLTGLRAPLQAGDKVPVTLTFRGADRRETAVTVQAEVREVTGAPADGKR